MKKLTILSLSVYFISTFGFAQTEEREEYLNRCLIEKATFFAGRSDLNPGSFWASTSLLNEDMIAYELTYNGKKQSASDSFQKISTDFAQAREKGECSPQPGKCRIVMHNSLLGKWGTDKYLIKNAAGEYIYSRKIENIDDLSLYLDQLYQAQEFGFCEKDDIINRLHFEITQGKVELIDSNTPSSRKRLQFDFSKQLGNTSRHASLAKKALRDLKARVSIVADEKRSCILYAGLERDGMFLCTNPTEGKFHSHREKSENLESITASLKDDYLCTEGFQYREYNSSCDIKQNRFGRYEVSNSATDFNFTYLELEKAINVYSILKKFNQCTQVISEPIEQRCTYDIRTRELKVNDHLIQEFDNASDALDQIAAMREAPRFCENGVQLVETIDRDCIKVTDNRNTSRKYTFSSTGQELDAQELSMSEESLNPLFETGKLEDIIGQTSICQNRAEILPTNGVCRIARHKLFVGNSRFPVSFQPRNSSALQDLAHKMRNLNLCR